MLTFIKALTQPENRVRRLHRSPGRTGRPPLRFRYRRGGERRAVLLKQLHIGSFGASWAVGSLLLGAIAGAAVAGYLADRISRKWTKLAGGCVVVGAAIASAVPPNVEILCAARFVFGLGVGSAPLVAPMYISEQSPRRLRGGMTAFNQVMITSGIMVAYLSDYARRVPDPTTGAGCSPSKRCPARPWRLPCSSPPTLRGARPARPVRRGQARA